MVVIVIKSLLYFKPSVNLGVLATFSFGSLHPATNYTSGSGGGKSGNSSLLDVKHSNFSAPKFEEDTLGGNKFIK